MKETSPSGHADASDRLIGILREIIEQRSLKPGDKLPSIRELAARSGLKAGTVRDALLKAQGSGIVKVLPRAGAFVGALENFPSSPSTAERAIEHLGRLLGKKEHNLFHILETREIIELETFKRATAKSQLQDLFPLRRILEEMAAIPIEKRRANYVSLDIRFHVEVARLSGNVVLMSVLCLLMEELKPRLLSIPWAPDRRRWTDESHARLYSALVEKDPEAAQAEVRTHLGYAYNSLLSELRQPPAVRRSAGASDD